MGPREAYQALVEAGPAEGPTPLAELPAAAGRVVAVMQNEVRGVLTQRIVLKGDADTYGENALVVKVDRSHGPADYDGPVGPPTRAKIAAELDEAFAGVDMRLSETFTRSSFGPFGYAVGHPRAHVTCVYAWSWGLAKAAKLGDGPTGEPSMPTQATSVRARLCRSSLGEAQIVSLIQGLQVFSPQSHLAYLDPGFTGAETQGDALAAAGVGYFVGVQPPALKRERLEAPPKPEKPQKHARHRRRHRDEDDEETRAAAEAPVRAPSPARAGVEVPMPTGAIKAPAVVSPLAVPVVSNPHTDMPLPSQARTAETPSHKGASVPLPN